MWGDAICGLGEMPKCVWLQIGTVWIAGRQAIDWYDYFFFFFNETGATEISPLSLHDALPIWVASRGCADCRHRSGGGPAARDRQCAPLQGNRRAGSESVPAGGGVNLWAAFAFFRIR